MEWHYLGLQRIKDALVGEDPTTVDSIHRELEEFGKDPYGYGKDRDTPGIVTLHGAAVARAGASSQALRLPGGWVMTYELNPDGLMPLAVPIIFVRAMVRMWSDPIVSRPDAPSE